MLSYNFPGLDELCFEILLYVYGQGSATEDNVVAHFTKKGKVGIEDRIKKLLEPEPAEGAGSTFMAVSAPGYLVETDKEPDGGIVLELSSKGRLAASYYYEHKSAIRSEKRRNFIHWLTAFLLALLAAVFGAVAALGAWREEIARFLSG